MVRVSPPDSKQDARQIVLDLAAPLASHIPLLQAIFSMGTYEFSFRAIWPNKGTSPLPISNFRLFLRLASRFCSGPLTCSVKLTLPLVALLFASESYAFRDVVTLPGLTFGTSL